MSDEILGRELASLSVLRESPAELRFRVVDPEIYPSHAPYDLVFIDPEPFSGPRELEDVCLRVSPVSLEPVGSLAGKRSYEFARCEVVPTEGRAFQVHILSASESQVAYGELEWTSVARVIARELRVEIFPT